MSNIHPECRSCKYHTPKTKGGEGRTCNGSTQPKGCSEWNKENREEVSNATY